MKSTIAWLSMMKMSEFSLVSYSYMLPLRYIDFTDFLLKHFLSDIYAKISWSSIEVSKSSRRRLFRWNWEFSRSWQYQWELQSALLQSWISRVNHKNSHHSPLKLFIYSRDIFLKKCWINKICFFQVLSGRRELKANLLFF